MKRAINNIARNLELMAEVARQSYDIEVIQSGITCMRSTSNLICLKKSIMWDSPGQSTTCVRSLPSTLNKNLNHTRNPMLLGGAGLARASYRLNWIQIALLWYQMYVTAHHISPYTLPKASVVMTEKAAEKTSFTLCNFYSGTILLAHTIKSLDLMIGALKTV